jgi:hypothetical protein
MLGIWDLVKLCCDPIEHRHTYTIDGGVELWAVIRVPCHRAGAPC